MISIEKTIAMLIGVPGTGKSTFYQKYLKKDFTRVNLDTLVTRKKESTLVNKLFKEGKSFAIDNTNCSIEDRNRYIPEAKKQGYRIIGYYFDPDLDTCLKRNKRRRGKSRVPEWRITDFYYTLIYSKPSYAEGFDEIHTVINDDKDMIITGYIE